MSFQTLAQPESIGQDLLPAQKFLFFLFERHCHGYIEFRYFSAGQPKVNDSSDFIPLPLEDKSFISEQVLSRRQRQMITFGPAPRIRPAKKGKAGSDRDIAEIGCLWADLDYDKIQGGAIEVVSLIQNLPLRPSVVVNSGYGRHVYYVFDEPLRDALLPEWKKMICSLRDSLGGDAVINPSRVMRLPGTLNLKYERAVECAVCEEESSWLRYSADEVKNFLAELPRHSGKSGRAVSTNHSDSFSNTPSGGFSVTAPTTDSLRGKKVTARVINAIITGKTEGSGDRSSRDFLIAAALLEKGFTEEEVKAVFRQYPLGCGSKWAEARHGEKYLDLTVSKAALQVKEKRENTSGVNSNYEDFVPPGYELAFNGSVWMITPAAREGAEPKRTLISDSQLRISEIRENIDSGQISVVISYKYLDRNRSTTILRSQMCDTRALVSVLSGEGAPVNSNNARLLVSYFAAYEHAFAAQIPRKKVSSRFGRGRSGKTFFLPGLSLNIEFAPNGPGDGAIFRAYAARQGSLGDWANIINSLEQNNLMIPQIAVAAAFVPPLQRVLQIPNFILDIFGNTSSGKSTTLKLAASVYGRPHDPDSIIHQWMNTKVAIEQVAGMCSELPIFLDDAQHCPDELKKTIVYMIANGKGKGRGARGGGVRETMTWQTVALSTSEEPLHEASPHEGARGRLLPIGGLTAPFPANSGALVQSLERAVALNHGYAGETFIRHLNGWNDVNWRRWQNRYTFVRNELLQSSASDIVGRVSGYIAAIGVAAEIACPLLGLKFKPDVMVAWLLNHLQEQQNNQNMVLLALRALADHYVANLNLFSGSDKYDGSRGSLQGVSKSSEYIGFMRATLDTIFARRKWNQTAILNKLAEAGVLHATESDRHTKKVSVEGIKHRMVCVKWSALFPDD